MEMSHTGLLEQVPVSKIDHAPIQLRANLEDLEELANSIKRFGLLQPIVIRYKQTRYEIVAGNRRFAATRLVGLRKISCHIVEVSEKEAYEVALIENLHQRTLNPVEEATAFERYVSDFGWGGVTELAKCIGKSQEFVSKRLALLKLPEKVRNEIIRWRMTPSVALEMLPLNAEDTGQLCDTIMTESLTKDQVRKIVRSRRNSEEGTHNKDGADSRNEAELLYLDRSVRKAIASLRSTLLTFDEIAKDAEEQWLLRALIVEHRQNIHRDIDTFIRLQKKFRRNPKWSLIVNRDGSFHNIIDGENLQPLGSQICYSGPKGVSKKHALDARRRRH